MSRAATRLARTKDSDYPLAPRGPRQDDLATIMERLYTFNPLLNLDRPAIGERCAAAVNADTEAGPTAFLRRYGPWLARYRSPRVRLDVSRYTVLPTAREDCAPVALRNVPVSYSSWLSRLADAELSTRMHREPAGQIEIAPLFPFPESSHVQPPGLIRMTNYIQQAAQSTLVMAGQVTFMMNNLSEVFQTVLEDSIQFHGPAPWEEGLGLRAQRDRLANMERHRHIYRPRSQWQPQQPPVYGDGGIAWARGSAETTHRVLLDPPPGIDDVRIRTNSYALGSSLAQLRVAGSRYDVDPRQAYEDRIDARRVQMQVEHTASYWNTPGYLSEELREAEVYGDGFDLHADPTPTGKGDPLAGVLGGMDRLLASISELVDDDA